MGEQEEVKENESETEIFETEKEHEGKETQDDPEKARFDRAKGTIMGALWGDAIGAVLEFYFKKITDKVANDAFKMPGGGAHNVGKGQITDDGELTMWLLHALCEGKGKIKQKEIARFYAMWIKSKPFDIGNTCRNSLFKANAKKPDASLIKKAALKSEKSQSNGALMRITPIAVFCHRIKYDKTGESSKESEVDQQKECVFKAAAEDTSYTHCNKLVMFVNGLYWYMITMVINDIPLSDIYSKICLEIENSKDEDLAQFLKDSQEDAPPIVNLKAGWIRHAFVFWLRYLRLAVKETGFTSEFYTKCITEVLKGGGDTDTNACIVGGLVGAIVGFKNIPEVSRKKVLSWPSKAGDGIKRDDFLKPSKYAEKLIKKLYDLAPESLEIE